MNIRYYLIQDEMKYFLRILAIASHIFCISSVSIVYSSTQLNSGLVIFDRSDYFGNDVLHANGGAIEANDNKLDLHNKIILDDEGLIIQGTNPFTLSGQISGIGKLIKLGSSNLILNSFNTYRGGTLTKEGQLTLGNSAALGSGILTVEGATKLDNSHHIPLNNPIKLNADLSIEGNQNLDINGIISGAGGLHKYGTSELMLNAVNHYSGGTVLYDGRLFLGNEDVLGSGSLNVKGEATLDHSSGFTLNNAIELDADLKLAGRYLTLNGTISGAGGGDK